MRLSLDILSISNSAVEVHEIFKCPFVYSILSQCLTNIYFIDQVVLKKILECSHKVEFKVFLAQEINSQLEQTAEWTK